MLMSGVGTNVIFGSPIGRLLNTTFLTLAGGAEYLTDDIVSVAFADGRLELPAHSGPHLVARVPLTRFGPVRTLRSGVHSERPAVLEGCFPRFVFPFPQKACNAK